MQPQILRSPVEKYMRRLAPGRDLLITSAIPIICLIGYFSIKSCGDRPIVYRFQYGLILPTPSLPRVVCGLTVWSDENAERIGTSLIDTMAPVWLVEIVPVTAKSEGGRQGSVRKIAKIAIFNSPYRPMEQIVKALYKSAPSLYDL